jgi:hypothetical protein
MPKRSVDKQVYWQHVVRRQRKSGLSIRQFCEDNDLSQASFYHWKRKSTRRDHQAEVSPHREGPSRRPKASSPKAGRSVFIPVRLNAAGSSVLEVVHPRGHVVRVPAVFDGDALRQVLHVLDQQGEM